jgi:hypothetical protein
VGPNSLNLQRQKEEEREIARAFLQAHPDFAGEPIIRWDLTTHDPPDVVCETASSRRVGIEIGQWANEGQMEAKSRERRELGIVEALAGLPTPHQKWTAYFLPTLRQLNQPEYLSFSNAFALLLKSVEKWDRRRDLVLNKQDISRFPPLGLYLDRVTVRTVEPIPPSAWVLPFGSFSFYDDDTMGKPLLRLIEKKRKNAWN